MESQAILQAIARQMLTRRGYFDAFSRMGETTDSLRNIYDRAAGAQRDRDLSEIEGLINTKEDDILLALEALGPGLVLEYLHFLAGAPQLSEHRPLYSACMKFGYPALSWEEIHAKTSTTSPLFLQNPQTAIFYGFRERLEPGFLAFKKGEIACTDLPYLNDRFYINGMILNLEPGGELTPPERMTPDFLRFPRSLFSTALSGWNASRGHLPLDEELRLCGLVIFACQELPDYEVFGPGWDREDASVTEHLDRAITDLQRLADFYGGKRRNSKTAAFAENSAQQVAEARALKERIAALGNVDLFVNPARLAWRIYDHLETEKLLQLSTPSPTPSAGPGLLMPDAKPL